MNYQETVQWMFNKLPMYQRVGNSAYKKDLSNTLNLAEHLRNPEKNFKSIHVAGTNGKGSTCHMLASILQEAGYKVGLYTSPHLKDFRERIKINGKEITEKFVMDFISKNKSFFEANQLSFFEMTVGMAFNYFSSENIDIAIIEVGLGGRLDSTNIISPEVSVITNIGLDHVAMLGNTLEAIAKEKAGIIKQNVPAVIGETQIETKPIFENIAEERGSAIFFADQKSYPDYKSDLKGAYQIKNISTALQTIEVLDKRNFKISNTDIIRGLLNVVKNTGLKGRWQILGREPLVICDTAHNKEGLSIVLNQLKNLTYNNLHIVFGVVKDKDLDSILPLLPKVATYYLAKPDIDRGMPVEQLQETFNYNALKNNAYQSVKQAYESAISKAKKSDVIFVGGSTFVVAEIL